MKRTLLWTPRVLGIAFAAFISLFALDVFSEGYTFWETILALAIHLVPTYLILIVLVVAWRWELIGGIMFVGLGAVFLAWFVRPFHWGTFLLLSGMPFLIGLLFLLNVATRGGKHDATDEHR
ncbi:MAG: hypothetical protein HY023_12415 [Chloroflexi bacterium]|nr:hypothetical protein [Chloroflexota bacterium]